MNRCPFCADPIAPEDDGVCARLHGQGAPIMSAEELASLDAPRPTVASLATHVGAGDRIAITAMVRYPGEDARAVSFVGFRHGAPGPIVMVTTDGSGDAFETFVVDPGRFGEVFGPDWVHRFYGA